MLCAISSSAGRAIPALRRARFRLLLLLVVAALAASAIGAGGDPPTTLLETAHLRPRPKPPEPRFGQSVAVGGTAALIGSPIDTDVGAVGGSVHVFRDGRGGWRRMQRITYEDAKADDRFGQSLAADGTWLVVGRDRADEAAPDAGGVAVYRRAGAHYRPETTLEPASPGSFDNFGSAVALSGATIAVGAPRNDDAAIDAGCVELFVFRSDRWQPEIKLTAPDGAMSDWFGFSVALAEDMLCVGAYGDDDRGSSSGSIYVYRRHEGSWGLEAKLVPDDLAPGDWFGYSVAAGRSLLAVGAPRDDRAGESAGCVRLLRRGSDGWEIEVALRPPEGSVTTWFGYCVALDGDRLLIGAPGDDTPERNGGAAYLYERLRGDWTLRAVLRPSEPEIEGLFGSSVALRGELAVVGRYPNEDGEMPPGSAWVYRIDRESRARAVTRTDPKENGETE